MNRHSRSIFNVYTLAALLLSLIGGAVQVIPAYAAGIVVNSNADTEASDGVCTLREAITAANTDAATGGCAAGSGADTITFAANYTITLVGSQLPAITTQMTITGKGAANTIIQADASPYTATYRVFEVSYTGTLTLDQVTVRNGRCYGSCATNDSSGGGIYNAGSLTVSNSTFSGNGAGSGGGIFFTGLDAHATVTNSTFSGNSADSGGGIYTDTDTLATVTNSTFSGNDANFRGGGIGIGQDGRVVVANSVFSGNNASVGGGIHAYFTVILTVTNTTFSDNSSFDAGGGVFLAADSITTVTNSTFNNNNTYDNGGGVYNAGSLTVTNSTFSGNNAETGDSRGGGIGSSHGEYGGSTSVTNSTFSGNSAGAGGGISTFGIKTTLKNTIVASNDGNNCFGVITNGGNNLDSGGTCGFGFANGSLSSIDPKLGPLANNGGTTHTMALRAGSPAIDAGRDTNCPAKDQRGVTRPRSVHCDMGAYEIAFPLTSTFADVPMDYLYWEDIEILYANGLTAGCSTSPLKFCPGDLMNRAQSAVFMMRGNFGTSYVPPASLSHVFKDDWTKGVYAEKWAEGMYKAGLTAGCAASPLKFCPWDLTPREQAAVFGLKLKYGNNYIPPPATGTVFADMTDTSYYGTKWAEQAHKEGLFPLCGTDPATQKPLFCPKVLVTRGLAAYIIARAKNLSMP